MKTPTSRKRKPITITAKRKPAMKREVKEFKSTAVVKGVQTSAAQRTTPMPPKRGDLENLIAYADPSRLISGKMFVPYNPSVLVTRKGLRIFDDMKKDEQVKAALAFKRAALLSGGWEVVSPDDEEDDWEVTEFVKDVLEQIQGGFNKALRKILLAVDYGYSVTEKLYEKREDGKLWLQALYSCKPHYFDFNADEHGRIMSLIQRYVPQSPQMEMPLDKFVVYTYDPEFENAYGRSELEAAYRPWWVKDNTYKWLSIMLERYGMPPIFVLYSQNLGSKADEIAKVVKNIQNATMGMIPRTNPDDLEFWTPQLAGQARDVFMPALQRFDGDIARAILMPSLVGFTPDEAQGSYARAGTHFDSFMLLNEQGQNDATQVVQDQIVVPLCDLNFPSLKSYPQFRLMKPEEDVKVELLNAWNTLVTGRIVNRLPDDEQHIRKMLKFPDNENPEVQERPDERQENPFGGGGGGFGGYTEDEEAEEYEEEGDPNPFYEELEAEFADEE